jgi:Fe-S-cluster containining protein
MALSDRRVLEGQGSVLPMEPGVSKEPFYAGGLRFSCTRCSSCCRFEPGFVFLSEKDVFLLAAPFHLAYTEFVEIYCRWVPMDIAGGKRRERLSLREKTNNDCIFWDGGCSVYEHRPLQCRTFPFWPSNLLSPERWDAASAFCPGMGRGALHEMAEIEAALARQAAEPTLIKGVLQGA